MSESEKAELKKAEKFESEAEGDDDDDDDNDEMEPKQKLIQIIISTAFLVAAYLIVRANPDLKEWQKLIIYLVPYLFAGFDVLKEAAESLSHGEALDEDFLMTVSTVCALLIGFVPGGESMYP